MEIIQINSREEAHINQVGGKARSLLLMKRAGLPVPPGFVLAVEFFSPWMVQIENLPAWQLLSGADVQEIEVAARQIQTFCEGLMFTSRQLALLNEALITLEQDDRKMLYAVRSSSPQEDLEGASFAGGYETTLGVTRDTLAAAVRDSFASAFGARVLIYGREQGLDVSHPRIAVIVQEQLDATSAGVAFSLNPLNNCYDEAIINANHGLGESVVSGEVDPDMYVVDTVQGVVKETRVGRKQVAVKLDRKGGTYRETPPSPGDLVLTEDQVLEIASVLKKVEAYFNFPVDIEWCYSGANLFLTQARPITTYLPLPEEMVTLPGEPKKLYANSTLIEQGVQGPLSVLGTDFLSHVLRRVGGEIARNGIGQDGITFTAAGGYYMNVSYATKIGMGKNAFAPGSVGEERVRAIMDQIDMQEYLKGEIPAALRSMKQKAMFTMLPMILGVLKVYLFPGKTINQYQLALPIHLKRFEEFSGKGLTLHEQAQVLCDLLPFFYNDYIIPMVLAAQVAQTRIRALFRDDLGTMRDDLINLGISLPGNKTTEMGQQLFSMAAMEEIGRYETAQDFMAALESNRLSDPFLKAWNAYVDEFGGRCPREIDVATPRPAEEPEVIFNQLKNLSRAIKNNHSSLSIFEEGERKRKEAYQRVYQAALQKGKYQAAGFARNYQKWELLGGYRETGKHYVIKVVQKFRRQILDIADTLVKEGRLDSTDQIFNLRIDDIDRALVDVSMDLRKVSLERSRIIHQMERSHLVVRIIDSRGKVFFPPKVKAEDGMLVGVPISPGVVQGKVKVLQTAFEKKLLPGEILVARVTDPGWTPLFIHAAGIVLEIGGALQHGAVVAREYGVPCVSGVDNATTLLKDGQMVEVDGSNGMVRLLDPS